MRFRATQLVPRRAKERLRGVVRREVALAQPPSETIVEVREVIEQVRALDPDQVLAAPYVAAVTVVPEPEATDQAFPRFAPQLDQATEFPVPPKHLWTVAEQFLESGQRDAERMLDVTRRAGLELDAGTRVLDLGCGPARVLRWLPPSIDGWGVDLNAERIAWCQAFLSPPFRFATCGTYPHLPFGDATFDLVYAGSVFTHIAELADSWLLELLRLTVPGGLLYLTVHDQSSIEFCRSIDPSSHTRALTGFAQPDATEQRFRQWSDRLGTDLDGFTIGRGYYAQVFYDRDSIVRHWARYAEVVDVVPEAFAWHQTAVLLRRRADDADWR
ncbi:MAG: class I SAM-dependent methyltransferase [Acidimicrobiia bacterium]|nr:class I SAM-dependent methyltransferase [Acidimicrobiia bacterium]